MTLSIETTQPSVTELPENYLIALTHYNAISLTGEEQSKYLQGQVTCDVDALEQEKLMFGAHCNAKGKVFSCFRLFNRENAHLLLQPKATIASSVAELKKFGVFAKVDIATTENLGFYALAGNDASQLLKDKFNHVPDNLSPTIQVESTTLVYLAGSIERYLIIDEIDNLEDIIKSFSLPIFPENTWNLLEINEGIPALTVESDNEYVPQMLNMQAINGISFTKGCYLGQETVARMQYLGKNKKALFALLGSNITEVPSNIIEKKVGENWRKAGDITSVYFAEDQTVSIQAVLNNDIDSTTELRIKGCEEQTLSIVELPYSLSQD